MPGGGYVLQPFFPFEEKEHDEGDDGHDAPKDKIGVAVGQKGDVFEVHAVDAGDEGQGDEYGGKNGQHFHDIVHAVADVGVVAVLLVGYHVVVNFNGFQGLCDQAFQVAQVIVGMRIDEFGIAGDKSGHQFFDRSDVFADVR